LRLESARSEHGWNVAASHPSAGSKLRTETVRGAEPIPERPPVVTFVIVVSVINPSSSFQNVCMKISIYIFNIEGEERLSWRYSRTIGAIVSYPGVLS
jgi:hypothetical protein